MRYGSKDYYKLLQVDPAADPEVVEAAFRRLAHKYHPDKSGAPDANARMQELFAAYEILRDPASRQVYDESRNSKPRSTWTTQERYHENDTARARSKPKQSPRPRSTSTEQNPKWQRREVGQVERKLSLLVILALTLSIAIPIVEYVLR